MKASKTKLIILVIICISTCIGYAMSKKPTKTGHKSGSTGCPRAKMPVEPIELEQNDYTISAISQLT